MRIRIMAIVGFLAGAAVGAAQAPPPCPTPQPTRRPFEVDLPDVREFALPEAPSVDPNQLREAAIDAAQPGSARAPSRATALPDVVAPSTESLTEAGIASPTDGLTAGVRRDSETCRLIKLLHACRLRSLESKKGKWEEISGRLSSLATLYKSIRDEEFISKELLDAIEAELAEAKQAAETPGVKFTPREALELAVLLRNQAYVTALCDRNATPSPYYNLKVGAEGFWRDGSPTDGFATVDFTFLNPAWLRAKLKFLVLELPPPKTGSCATLNYDTLLESSELIHPEFDILRADRKDFPDLTSSKCRVSLREVFLERAGQITTAARNQLKEISGQEKCEREEKKASNEALDKAKDDVAAAEAALSTSLNRMRLDKPGESFQDLSKQLKELHCLREIRDQREDEAMRHDANLAALGRRRAERSGAIPLCSALADFEELMDRLMLRLEERSWKALLFGRPRVGPYVLPDPVEVAIAPIWFNARLGTEPVPDPTKGNEAGDPLFDNAARPVVSFGLQKLWNIRGSTILLGPYAGAGTMLGTLPGEQKEETASRRTFFDLGLYSQTQYRVSASDAAAKIRDVVGSLYFGYRRANYLKRDNPGFNPRVDEGPQNLRLIIDSPHRAIAELRLRYEMGGEQTVTPFIYITVDRSASLSKKLARDRMGIAFEVDLKKAFAPFGKALGVSEMAPSNPTP
ncbi:MAG TPA: hypothetical protein VLG15_05045 [Thermoanaerobaculia bacterium]|nr:hypothetical protein [Thermoanaerobaculia bacterium]